MMTVFLSRRYQNVSVVSQKPRLLIDRCLFLFSNTLITFLSSKNHIQNVILIVIC